ncbi:MAG: CBS domain-containing protein [Anaerolineales bacterium]|jgi:CBS domain-containing protein
MKIAEVLASKGSNVITIQPQQTIREAVKLMEKHNIGGLVVVDAAGKIVGMLTERDLIRYAATEQPSFSASVSSIMTKNVIVGVLQDEIDAVAHTMTEKRFRHLPVVEGEKLVGILTIGDVVKAQRDRYQGEVHTLQIQVIAADEQE